MIDINKAKQKILDLAIRGKLTKQLKSDGNAADLLVEIQKEKEKLIKQGKIKKDKKDKKETYIYKNKKDNLYYEKFITTETDILNKNVGAKQSEPKEKCIQDELSFEIPNNWVWCRQYDVCMLYNGILSDNKELPYLEARVIRGQKEPLIINKGIKVDKDEYIILVDGENSGEIMKVPYNGYMGSTFKILLFYKREISDFVKFNIDLEKQELKDNKTGSAIPHLNKKIFREKIIPLPPLAEQNRIVEKVDKLFEILDKIDEAQKKYQKDKEILKSKIIEAGIRGKLTKQLKSDGNASDLLDEIRKEKEMLIKEGKIKRDKKETYIYKNPKDNLYYEKHQDGTEKCIQDELPFEIPEKWTWCRQEYVCLLYNGEFNNNEDLPYLEAKVLRGKKNAISAKKGVKVNKGDYVILVDGENSGEVMKVPYSGYMGSTFKILLVYYNKIADYIKYNIDLERKDLKENKTGSAVPHLNKKIFKRKIIPLPPLAEQERIVKVIESTLKVIN